MILAIITIILVAVITFFHYTQGFWSATLSAIIAVLAAALAIGYHESVVNSLLKGKMADQAYAIGLVAVFGLTYLILRTIVDKAIPGNLRLPVILDKAGAGVMGFVAGVFSVGVVAIAAQTLPFGPGMHARFPLAEDRTAAIQVAGKSQYQETAINDQLDADTFEGEGSGLLLPVDNWVIGFVSHLSDGGSLAGKRALTDVHPNYLDEMFAQRLGIQPGAAHVATNAVKQQVGVLGVFRAPPTIPQLDGEPPYTRPNNKVLKWPVPKEGESYFVVRIQFNDGTADGGKAPEHVRFSPGSIRLVARSDDEGAKNYFPIGTIENGSMLLAQRLDDYMFATEGAAVDVAFLARNDEVLEGKTNKVKEGVFIEVKRLAREDLAGKTVAEGVKPDKGVSVVRKGAVTNTIKAGIAPPPATPKADAKKPAAAPSAAPTPEGVEQPPAP